MNSRRYFQHTILVTIMLFVVFTAVPLQAADAFNPRAITPDQVQRVAPAQVKTIPGVLTGTPITSECIITSVSPASSEAGDEVLITGQGLSVNCSVYFQIGQSGAYGNNVQVSDPSHLKVSVPFLSVGTGTVAVNPRNNAGLSALNPAGHVIPFEVKPLTPVIMQVSQPSALPGTKILLNCSNLHLESRTGYTVYFISSKGFQTYQAAELLNATTLRVIVPDMENLTGAQADLAHVDSICIQSSFSGAGGVKSNYVSFKALPLPQCTVVSVSKAYEIPGKYVALTGSKLCRECDVVFWGSDGKSYPVIMGSKWGECGNSLSAQVPQMPAGKGFISTGPAGSPKAGGTIPFEVLSAQPLAPRVDYQYLKDLINGQQKILSRTNSKRYSAPGNEQPPFEVDANYEVYQNGNVYTYIYNASIYEPAVATKRDLNFVLGNWPDLDNTTLKWGAISVQPGDIIPCSERIYRTGLSVSGCGKQLKRIWVYLKSYRPPVVGTVRFYGLSTDQSCDMYDAYVPAP